MPMVTHHIVSLFPLVYSAITLLIFVAFLMNKRPHHHDVPEKVELKHIMELFMTIKDDLNTIIANQAKGATVDLTPILTPLAAVQTGVDTANTGITAIQAEFVATPPAPPTP